MLNCNGCESLGESLGAATVSHEMRGRSGAFWGRWWPACLASRWGGQRAGLQFQPMKRDGEKMRIQRRFTKSGQSPYEGIAFRSVTSEIRNPDGSVVFRQEDIEVPAKWSQVASDILAQKYFRKAGVPAALRRVEEAAVPSWLWRSVPDEAALADLPGARRTGSERSARDVFHRLAGTWTYWGWKGGYFNSEDDAQTFYDEHCYTLAAQKCAPNSPQWFNTGLHWAYGIEGPGQGHFYVDHATGELVQSTSAY